MVRIESQPSPIEEIAHGPAGFPWRAAHEVYLRLLAVAHLAWALWEWAALIGLIPPIDPKMALSRQGATYFFAGLDPVAAVGLWFGAAWGVATWFVVTFARIVIHTAYAGVFGWNGPWTVAQIVSLLVYLATFLLAERSDRLARKRAGRRRSESD